MPRRVQERPGAPRSAQERPGAPRSSQERPGALRSAQERPGAPRSAQERSVSHLYGILRQYIWYKLGRDADEWSQDGATLAPS